MRLKMLGQILSALAETSPRWIFLWFGLAALSVALLAMVWTRWGQTRPLHKCVILSVLSHALLAVYATTVQIVSDVQWSLPTQATQVTIVDSPIVASQESSHSPTILPWENLDVSVPNDVMMAAPKSIEPVTVEAEPTLSATLPEKSSQVSTSIPESIDGPQQASKVTPPDLLDDRESLPDLSPAELSNTQAPVTRTTKPGRQEWPEVAKKPVAGEPEGILEPELNVAATVINSDLPRLDSLVTHDPSPVQQNFDDLPQMPTPVAMDVVTSSGTLGSTTPPGAVGEELEFIQKPAPLLPTGVIASQEAASVIGEELQESLASPTGQELALETVPKVYRLRLLADRIHTVKSSGGSEETEQAVEAALQWLADAQSNDGRWDPDLYEGGRETNLLGHDRGGAGARADTGISGLALLAFLGAGHTHKQGDYQATVQAGLAFLIRSQRANGELAGEARDYARMYCHAMATFALAEAYAITGDITIEPALRKAVTYCISAQHPQDGGWRYHPGEHGDTSQLGWQLLALKSAEQAGIVIPQRTTQGMIRYLISVSQGRHGGLSSYRPDERPSRTMTAEALFCRQLLGMSRENPASDEAAQFLMEELPGKGLVNLYYWYYATLAMYQIDGEYWQKWNQAIAETLLPLQRHDGSLAGSWDVDQVWGPHGGRVFTTALAALCLETYYRYAPIYTANGTEKNGVTR